MITRTASATAQAFILTGLALFCIARPVVAQNTPTIESSQASVFILDDLSGEELLKKHGIAATTKDDMLMLLDGVWEAGCGVELRHLVIDEDSTDQAPALLKLAPFTAKRPPGPATIGSMREIEDSRAQYFKDRAIYQRAASTQLEAMKQGVTAFMQSVAETQLATAQRFDAKLEQRKGRDFNRSDVAGAVTTAGRILGNSGVRVLLVNSDCADAPGTGKPRRTAFTAQELDPGIAVIFINQSRLPDQSPLFKGVKNPVEHADSMQEAMKLVIKLLKAKPQSTSGTSLATGERP